MDRRHERGSEESALADPPLLYNKNMMRNYLGRPLVPRKGRGNRKPAKAAKAAKAATALKPTLTSSPTPLSRQTTSSFGQRPSSAQVLTRASSSMAVLDRKLAAGRKVARAIPASLIPQDVLQQANVEETAIWPLAKVLSRKAYDESPVSQVDVRGLARWTDHMLREIEIAPHIDLEDQLEDMQNVYYMAFFETSRQVMATSFQRGEYMLGLWHSHSDLLTAKHKVSEAKAGALQDRVAQLERTVSEQRLEISSAKRGQSANGGGGPQAQAQAQAQAQGAGRAAAASFLNVRQVDALNSTRRKSVAVRRKSLASSAATLLAAEAAAAAASGGDEGAPPPRQASRRAANASPIKARRNSVFQPELLRRLDSENKGTGGPGPAAAASKPELASSSSSASLASADSSSSSPSSRGFQGVQPRRKSAALPIFERFFRNMEEELKLSDDGEGDTTQQQMANIFQADENELRVKLLQDDLAAALERIADLEEELADRR